MEERIEKTFETPDGCDLTVENVRGAITVVGWDQNTTQIVATSQNGAADIEIGQEGRTITARTKHEQGMSGWLDWLTGNKPPLVDYEVHVPHASNLRLKNVSGPINAQDVNGDVRVNDVDGTAVLTAIKGEVRAETVNGSLQAQDIEGTAKLHTVNGRMRVQEGSLSALKADTVNGDIEVGASLALGGEYTFHTVNGSCRLMLANAPYASVSAHGVNMSVDCKVPADGIERSMGSWKATIGTGEGPRSSIRFDTVNGRLYIDGPATGSKAPAETFVAKSQPTPEPTPAAAPEPPVEPVEAKVAVKSKTEILQMVERGEISVDEAIGMLQEAQ
jgi:hypothetical protein